MDYEKLCQKFSRCSLDEGVKNTGESLMGKYWNMEPEEIKEEKEREEIEAFIKEREKHEKEVTENYLTTFGNDEKRERRFKEMYYLRDFKPVVDDFVKLLGMIMQIKL